jgi:WD40 repeat protein
MPVSLLARPRFSKAALLLFAAAAMASGAAEPAARVSDIVAAGIGKQFPATGLPLHYDPWPTPLHAAPGAMMTAVITADGQWVATGSGHPSQPGELALWDAATGKRRWLRRYARGIRSLACTPNGRQLVAGGYDGIARLLDLASGQLLREFRGHAEGVNAVAVSQDGRWLVTGGLDSAVILWNLESGARIRAWQAPADVLTVAIRPDGQQIATAGRDNAVRLWNPESGELQHTLAGHEGSIEMVAFAPQGKLLASASWDGTLRLWNTATGVQQGLLRRETRLVSVAFEKDGKQLWCGGFDGKLARWDLASDAAAQEISVQEGAVFAVSLSADGSRIATCGFEGKAGLWQPDGTRLQVFDPLRIAANESGAIASAAWSPREDQFALVQSDGALRLIQASDHSTVGELRIPGEPILQALFAPAGDTLYVATRDGQLYRWNPADKQASPKAIAKLAAATTLLSLVSDDALVLGSEDGVLELRTAKEGQLRARVQTGSSALCAALAADKRRVYTGHADGRVRRWDLETLRELPCEIRTAQPIRGIAVDPTRRLAAFASGSRIEIWEIQAGQEKRRNALASPEGEITQLLLAPQSQQLISADSSGQIRLWTLEGGAARTLPRKTNGAITSLALAPRSETLISAGADGTAWLWQTQAVEEVVRPLASIPAHEKGTRYVALAQDKRLISDGYDNHVLIWNLASGEKERDLGMPDTASACVLTPDGKRIAVGHWSKRIGFVEVATGQRQDNLRGLPRGPYAIAVSPREDRMAAAFRELGALVYDLKSDEADPVITLPPDELPYTHVAFSPDGKSFVTCTGDYQRMQLAGKVRMHDAKTGALLQTFVGHTSEVKMSTFRADGKRLATACGDKTVRVWDVANGEAVATLPHPIGTFAPLFVEKSDLLLTADYHGEVYVWDYTQSALLQTVTCHADLISRLAISDDQSVLVTGSRDGTVRLWKLAGQGNRLRVVDRQAEPQETATP